MKKICGSIGLVLFMFAISIIGVNAEETNVVITKATCSSMYNGKLKENLNVEIKNLDIAVEDVKFSKAGDYTKCELEVANNSKDEIVVDATSVSKLSNDFVSYDFTTADATNNIAIGKTKIFNLNINYRKEYAEDKVLDNVVEIKLQGDSNIENPSTNSTLFMVLGIIMVAGVSTAIVVVINKNDKKKIASLIILVALIAIPTVSALTNVTITLKNKIIIEVPGSYHVYYRINEVVFIPENELKNYDLTQANCDYDFYVMLKGDATNTKYFKCDGEENPIIFNSGEYKGGSQVNLQVYNYNKTQLDCEEKDGYYLCNSFSKDNIRYWLYSKAYNPDSKDTDKDVMNFVNALDYDSWAYKGVFGAMTPNSFTMPNHSVVFNKGVVME